MLPRVVARHLPDGLTRVGKRVQNLNYDRRIYAFEKRVNGVRFVHYSFVSPPNDELLDQLLVRTREGDVVYDVGAYTGMYTLALAGNGCRTHAFEPNPVTYRQLTANVEANDFDEITTHDVGLGNKSGTVPFYISSSESYSSFLASNARRNNNTIVETEQVQIQTLDDLCSNGLAPPDHLKIDGEGFGVEILLGGRETISTHRPTIYFEPHPTENNEGGDTGAAATALLRDEGYSRHEYEDGFVFVPA